MLWVYFISCTQLLISSEMIPNNVNPFTHEFPKWTHRSINLDTSIVADRGLVKISNSETDETALHEPSYLDLHCLQRYYVCLLE